MANSVQNFGQRQAPGMSTGAYQGQNTGMTSGFQPQGQSGADNQPTGGGAAQPQGNPWSSMNSMSGLFGSGQAGGGTFGAAMGHFGEKMSPLMQQLLQRAQSGAGGTQNTSQEPFPFKTQPYFRNGNTGITGGMNLPPSNPPMNSFMDPNAFKGGGLVGPDGKPVQLPAEGQGPFANLPKFDMSRMRF